MRARLHLSRTTSPHSLPRRGVLLRSRTEHSSWQPSYEEDPRINTEQQDQRDPYGHRAPEHDARRKDQRKEGPNEAALFCVVDQDGYIQRSHAGNRNVIRRRLEGAEQYREREGHDYAQQDKDHDILLHVAQEDEQVERD